ncbi:unnamed protein product (macronuclear) [Paramecium tetraurelia]|uniref:Uncharacterized protein n=1 Tax=Paramecium tetraurelia TaxID=5888 RepID=A0EEU9_PARTE|nr:uncharacterized protein GSPATT00026163001 [Paramecium tetraurelia]CAK93840.1 unnamed protein product [Paramecium tetraurelia]|eukprot:XP_001461213.1 hypothetical protein (macronuclear) [Paramecium tetraurelia strain d4-2]
MGQEKLAALLLYRQLFKSLGNPLSRDQLRKYYKYTVQARVHGGENQQILKNLEIYLKAIKTQNLIMDAENIGKPKDYKADIQKVANYVGLRMPEAHQKQE